MTKRARIHARWLASIIAGWTSGVARADAQTAEPSAAPPPTEAGRVVEVEDGVAVIELHPERRLPVGSSVRFVAAKANTATVGAEGPDVLAFGQVRATSEGRAFARIEINGRVRAGMRVVFGSPGDETFNSPRLPGPSIQLSLVARPFLAVLDSGFGMLNEVELSYLFAEGLRFQLEAAPFGFGFEPSGSGYGLRVHATLSVATQWFEVGIGLGEVRLQDFKPNPEYTGRTTGGDYVPEYIAETIRAFSVQPMLRFGNEDGLALRGRFSLSKAQFGDVYVDARIPVSYGVQLVFAGGGGDSGHRFGEAGVRVLVWGSGADSSVFLRMTAGVMGLDRAPFNDGGPSVGVGIDWRL